MSSSDHSQDLHKMKQWRRQPAEIRMKDLDVYLQNLLDWAARTASYIGKVPLAIKERSLLADLQRVKGDHGLAITIYESLIDYASELVSTPDFNPGLWDKEIIGCLSKAFT